MRDEKAERREDVERRRTPPSAFIVALRSLVATSHEMTLVQPSPVKSIVSSLESHMHLTCRQHTHAIAHTTTPQRLTQPTSAGGDAPTQASGNAEPTRTAPQAHVKRREGCGEARDALGDGGEAGMGEWEAGAADTRRKDRPPHTQPVRHVEARLKVRKP